MVGPGHPFGLAPLHSLVTYENVLYGIVQGMAHMKNARDIRRRNYNSIRFLFGIGFGAEEIFLFPILIPLVLNVFRIVPGGNFSHDKRSD